MRTSQVNGAPWQMCCPGGSTKTSRIRSPEKTRWSSLNYHLCLTRRLWWCLLDDWWKKTTLKDSSAQQKGVKPSVRFVVPTSSSTPVSSQSNPTTPSSSPATPDVTTESRTTEEKHTNGVDGEAADSESVNDYRVPDTKRARMDDWVGDLYSSEATDQHALDIFTAFQECQEFLQVSFDLPEFTSNRQRKAFERHPVAYLVKKMKDAEVSIAKLPVHERVLFERAKLKEVDSFVKNEAVRRCLDSEEVRKAYESKRIVRARWVLTWKLTPAEELQEALHDRATNEKTVYIVTEPRKPRPGLFCWALNTPVC